MIMSVEKLRELLQDMSLVRVAEKAGVSYDSLVRFARGETQQPHYLLIDALRVYFNAMADKIAEDRQ